MGKPHAPYWNSKLPGANFVIFAPKSKFREIRRRLSHSMRNDLTKKKVRAMERGLGGEGMSKVASSHLRPSRQLEGGMMLKPN